MGIGCWLWPARGSGVYVSVGKSLTFRKRIHAIRAAGFGVWKPERMANGSKRSRLQYSDSRIAQGGARRGYTSVQMLYGNPFVIYGGGMTNPTRELVLAHPVCIEQRVAQRTACLPDGIPMRQGWRAKLPCKCPKSIMANGDSKAWVVVLHCPSPFSALSPDPGARRVGG